MTPNSSTIARGHEDAKSSLVDSFEIERTDLVRIRIARTIYRDHEFVDIRTYVKNDLGEFVPTKKGITLAPEQLPKFISGLENMLKKGEE